MNILDEYRRNARECQRMADSAGNAADKASWLRLAASWLGMIKNDPKQPFENEPKNQSPETGDEVKSSDHWPKSSDEDSQASH